MPNYHKLRVFYGATFRDDRVTEWFGVSLRKIQAARIVFVSGMAVLIDAV